MIPRVVHRIWLGGDEPEWLARFAETWTQPGWELREWGDDDVAALFPLRNQDLYDRAEEIAPDHVGQLRSDLVRYEILHRLGGVYVDADFECRRAIDELIAGADCFVVRVTPRWLNNALMGAVPAHPFLERLIDGLPANVEAKLGSKPNRLSGPQYLTPLWRKHGEDVRVLKAAHFYPYLWDELERGEEDFSGCYAVHHWANRRRERGVAGVAA